jgi:hypothetical protein
MPRHVWSVLCRKTMVDNGNLLSIFEVMDELSAFPQPPDEQLGQAVVPYPMTLVTLWSRNKIDVAEKCTACARIIGPSGGRELSRREYEIDLTKFVNSRAMLTLPGILYVGFGRYEFEVSLLNSKGEAKPVALVPLDVKLGPDPNAKKN